jgi:hypothetical protein
MDFRFKCVHDPAWWWVQASNLWTASAVVVRFNLAHVADLFGRCNEYHEITVKIGSCAVFTRKRTMLGCNNH